jgi:small subunit ribosomal protein S18
MARNNDRDRGSNTNTRRAPKDTGRRMKKKVCIFCKDQIAFVDYKEVNLLRKFMSDRGKIRARRVSGNCSQHQRDVAVAIKTARELALLPYTQRTTSDRPGGRGAGGRPGGGRSGGGSGYQASEAAPAATPEAADEAVAELLSDIDNLEAEFVGAETDDEDADGGAE